MSDWFDNLNPIDDPEFECSVCSKPLYNDRTYCSDSCFQADLR